MSAASVDSVPVAHAQPSPVPANAVSPAVQPPAAPLVEALTVAKFNSKSPVTVGVIDGVVTFAFVLLSLNCALPSCVIGEPVNPLNSATTRLPVFVALHEMLTLVPALAPAIHPKILAVWLESVELSEGDNAVNTQFVSVGVLIVWPVPFNPISTNTPLPAVGAVIVSDVLVPLGIDWVGWWTRLNANYPPLFIESWYVICSVSVATSVTAPNTLWSHAVGKIT